MVTLMHVSLRPSRLGHADNLQSTEAETRTDTYFTSPAQLQCLELPHGNGKHPQVCGDAYSGVGPYQRVGLYAAAPMFAVPLIPEVAHQCALIYAKKNVDGAPYRNKCDSSPKQSTNGPAGKDADVKKEQRQL